MSSGLPAIDAAAECVHEPLADVAMGFLLTHDTISHFGAFVHLLITSTLRGANTAGMVLNDVFDREQDRGEQPLSPFRRNLRWFPLRCG